ncbi:MAG TPA: TlpA disulfide reductase family protein [Candidatus Bathyarchaeia archaeon]
MSRFLSIMFALFLIGLSLSGIACAQQTAPNFTLTDVDGAGFSLSNFRGSTVVLSFISTRVIFCKATAYVFVSVSKIFGDEVVFILVGVSSEILAVGGDSEAQLREFRDEVSFEGFVARDTSGVAAAYGVNFVPSTFIIDQTGVVRHKHFGAAELSEQALTAELQAIVPEFSSLLLLLPFMVFAVFLIVLSKKRVTRLTSFAA